MADQPALVSMAQQFTGLPMKALIGAPLAAAAEANQQMALTQVSFLMDTCFHAREKDTDPYKPIMVDMVLTRGVIQAGTAEKPEPTMAQVSSTINLPILTILPLNSLAVDNVQVDFEMEVKSSYSEDHSKDTKTENKAEGSFKASVGIGWFSAEVSGSVSSSSSTATNDSTHYEKSNSAKYTVSVHAGQLPLPEGVTTIIQAYSQNITPIQMPAPAAPTPPPT